MEKLAMVFVFIAKRNAMYSMATIMGTESARKKRVALIPGIVGMSMTGRASNASLADGRHSKVLKRV
jgi:hypothetical protein